MNHAQVIDHELRLFNQFKAEGKRLLHFCPDWDDMTIHSEMDEIAACCCDFELEIDNALRDSKTEEIEKKRRLTYDDPMRATNMMLEASQYDPSCEPVKIFSSDGAPAHSGTELDLDTEVALVCMIVSNPGNRERAVGWQKRVNDLLRKMRDRIKELESK